MTAPDHSHAELADRGRQTVARIRAALDAGQSASIAQIVELIREVTCKFDSISVQGLGEVIGRDLLTMSRVISVAHTLGYNPEGVEISTINQAIHVIGFNKIRNLALSLMLLRNAATDTVSEKRHVAASALVAGLIAQAVRARQHPEDAEEAFVCAALRNYGRIMLANFLPEDYRRALTDAGRQTEAAALRSHFGLTPLELSVALLEQSRMPRSIMHGLRELTAHERATSSLPAEMGIPVVADFAEELCRLAGQNGLDVEQFTQKAMRLVQAYGDNVGLAEPELFEVLEAVSATLQMFGALQSGHSLSCPLVQRVKALAAGVDPAVLPAPARPAATTVAKSIELPTSRQFRDPLVAGIAALMEREGRDAGSIAAVYDLALTAIHSGLGLAHTLVFRRNDESGRFHAWLGAGDFFALIHGEELLDPKVRDVFSVCLKRTEDVLIQNPADPKIQPFIPDWLRPAAGAQPLILLPVRDERGTVTVFCGLRGSSEVFALSARQTQQLRAMRERLAGFEARVHAPAGIADAPAAA